MYSSTTTNIVMQNSTQSYDREHDRKHRQCLHDINMELYYINQKLIELNDKMNEEEKELAELKVIVKYLEDTILNIDINSVTHLNYVIGKCDEARTRRDKKYADILCLRNEISRIETEHELALHRRHNLSHDFYPMQYPKQSCIQCLENARQRYYHSFMHFSSIQLPSYTDGTVWEGSSM